MIRYLLFILIFSTSLLSFSQVDSVEVEELTRILNSYDENNYIITDTELDYLKQTVLKDVENWCNEPNDTLENLWPKMIAQDTAVFVTIKLDTGSYELDVIDEYKRRVIGGFAGSYPFAETWSFNVSEDTLIEVIRKLKANDNSLQVPNETELLAGRNSYWFYIKLFDNENDEVIHIWTRASTSTSSTLALVGYSKYANSDLNIERQLINADFWKLENDKRIEKFEKLVIEKIRGEL